MSQRFCEMTVVDTLRVCTEGDPSAYVDLKCTENGMLTIVGGAFIEHVDDPNTFIYLSCNTAGFLSFIGGGIFENGVDPGALTNSSAIFACDTDGALGSGVSSIAFRTEEPLLTGSYTANRAIPAMINGTNVLLLCQYNEAT